MTEMQKLINQLAQANIPFEVGVHRHTLTTQVFYPSAEKCVCDAICHEFSYGGPEGFLEIMGLCSDVPYDDVLGWLTAEQVFERIKAHYEKEGK